VPECRSVSVARHGAGTERLEHELTESGLPVWRLDADVSGRASACAPSSRRRAACLVGTQMVAKGHDFPDVTLGVVLDADATLRFPDFRAEERTFALVAQLAGRAGRGSAEGKVLVQTLAPDAPSIEHASRHDADGFLEGELERRRVLRYPPFATLVKVVCSSPDQSAALAAATAVRDRLGVGPPKLLGPAPLFRLRGRERFQLVVKADNAKRGRAVAAIGAAVDAVAAAKGSKDVAISVDVDPQ
jgi:primosomal protein N' (replication factor Y)